MRKLILPIMLVIGVLLSHCSADTEVKYGTYVNNKFDYEVQYPEKVLIPQGEAANGAGQVFESKDKKAVLKVNVIYNTVDVTLEESFKESQSGTVTEKVIDEKDAWFQVSGVKDGTAYYVKKYLIEDIYFIYEFEYSEDMKDKYGPINKVMSESFKVE